MSRLYLELKVAYGEILRMTETIKVELDVLTACYDGMWLVIPAH